MNTATTTPKKNGNGKHSSFGEQMRAQLEGLAAKEIRPKDTRPFPRSKGAELVDLSLLVESKMNPRQNFEGLEELAASIKASGGLLVPIVARQLPGLGKGGHYVYEIVDGARRFRALGLLWKAGEIDFDKVLVDVRVLTDAQAAEAMMMADQRDTLKPLEQARGYANMIATGFTPDSIAEQLGVCKGTVIGRLKLLELGPAALKLLEAGVLTTAIATPLGRYPLELQQEALERMFDDKAREGMGGPSLWRYDGDYHKRYSANAGNPKKLNVGMAIAWLQEHFTKSLKTTVFDQDEEGFDVGTAIWSGAGLASVPSPGIAPSCKACPKNSNNMPHEVAGENAHGRSSAGFCTLPPCFDAKWVEGVKRMRTEAKEKGEVKVLGATASAAALRKITNSDSRYAKASEVNHSDTKKRTWGQLLELANKNLDEGERIRKVLAVSEEGRAQLVEKAEVEKVLAAEKVLPQPKKEPKTFDYVGHQRREDQRRALHMAISFDVLKQYTSHLREKEPGLPVLRALVEHAEQQGSSDDELEVFGLKSRRELDTFIEKKATLHDMIALLYMRMVREEISYTSGFTDEMERAAKELKIDLKKREAEMVKAKKGETETTEEGDE